jgi:hypothetical protein
LDYAEFSILTPYPGTLIYEHAKKNNLLLTEDWSKYTGLEPVMQIKSVSASNSKTSSKGIPNLLPNTQKHLQLAQKQTIHIHKVSLKSPNKLLI